MRTQRILKSFAARLIYALLITFAPVAFAGSRLNISRPQDPAEKQAFQFARDCTLAGFANISRVSKGGQTPAANKSENSNGSLEEVLHRMDQTAASFHSAEAEFVWKNYTSVVNAFSDPQNGKIYFRRAENGTEMAADLLPPAARQIVFMDGKVRIYTPGTGEVQEYDASAHREEFETFLVLGFGSRGTDLHKSFEVTYGGHESANGTDTDKLELVPTSPGIKARFPKIDLWIDSRGVSVRQQLFEESGDYRLADYSNIKINPPKLPKDAFKLKTSGKPKVVSH